MNFRNNFLQTSKDFYKNFNNQFIFGSPVTSILRYSLLFLAFLLFASIPPILLFWISDSDSNTVEDLVTSERKNLPSVLIPSNTVSLRISNSENLEPFPNSDFLLFAWIKLVQLPSDNERIILFRKYNPRNINLPGYALSLIRVKGGDIRLSLYWKNEKGLGGWEALDKFNIPPKEWFLVTLSSINNEYAGVHILHHKDNNQMQLSSMGGIKLAEGNLANSIGLLEFGARGNGNFKGRVGPLGVFRLTNLEENFKEILKDQFKNPQLLSSKLNVSEVLLWSSNAREDLSSFKRNMRVTGSGQFRKRDLKTVK